jgi:hypothetical protein
MIKPFRINIFAPTYHRNELTIKCLESIVPAIENSVYNVHLYIGDNNIEYGSIE